MPSITKTTREVTRMPNNISRFTLGTKDWKSVLKNSAIFAAPALLVLIATLIQVIPPTWKYGALTLYILNILTNILKKVLDGEKQ